MLIVRGLRTLEAEANDADDYRHFMSGGGALVRKRISDSRTGAHGEFGLPTLSAMPRTGVPFIRTLVWSAVLLAAVRRTLDTKATDYKEHIQSQKFESLLCIGLIYWADTFMTDADGSMTSVLDDFMALALEDPSQVNPDRLAEADIVKECADRLSRDSAYEGWREALLLVMETVRLSWTDRSCTLRRQGACAGKRRQMPAARAVCRRPGGGDGCGALQASPTVPVGTDGFGLEEKSARF